MRNLISKINNCNNLSQIEIKKISEKLNVDYETNKNNICNILKKKIIFKNPCLYSIHNDTKLKLKNHQINVSNLLLKNDSVIVVHSIGTGKTFTAIVSAQCLLLNNKIDHVIVITPTSLQQNFKNQAKLYGLSQEFLDENYTFYTINGLINAIKLNKQVSPINTLIIIDEAHNLRKLDGEQYKIIFKFTKRALKILLLTATPLINYDYDIINLVSIARKEKAITINKFEKLLDNENEFKKYVENLFNFYKKDVEKSNDYPNKKIINIFLPMSKSYYKIYKDVEEGEVSKIPDFKDKNIQVFYNGLRRISNVIDNKSKKVDWIINKIKDNLNSKFLIFSHFITMGIVPIINWLKKKKIKFRNITGELSIEERDKAVDDYNNNIVNILFITKAGGEGLNLRNTNFIIIMEPTWNISTINQIIGRGIRYKSHDKINGLVKIYNLFSLKPNEMLNLDNITNNYLLKGINDEMLSVDLYLKNYSHIKQKKIDKFYNLLFKYRLSK